MTQHSAFEGQDFITLDPNHEYYEHHCGRLTPPSDLTQCWNLFCYLNHNLILMDDLANQIQKKPMAYGENIEYIEYREYRGVVDFPIVNLLYCSLSLKDAINHENTYIHLSVLF